MFPGMDPDDIDNAIANYYYSCNAVSDRCPVQATTLGYYPTRGINIFFAIGFGAAAIAALALGVKKKTWSYTGFVVAGSALELAGGLCLFLDVVMLLGQGGGQRTTMGGQHDQD